MRIFLIPLLALVCLTTLADEVDLSNPETTDASVSNDQAEASRQALTNLINGGEKTLSLEVRRGQNVRSDEPSVGLIPPRRASAQRRTQFAALRNKIKQAHDVTVVASELEDFVEVYPSHREARLALGRLQILMEQPATAIETLAPLLSFAARTGHPDWQPWFWAGTAYLAMGKIDQARTSMDVALAKNGAKVEIWVQLAVIEQELNNHAGALQYLAIAEQIDSDAAVVHLNRAYSLEQLDRFNEALQAYRSFLFANMTLTSAMLRPSVMRRITKIASAVENPPQLP